MFIISAGDGSLKSILSDDPFSYSVIMIPTDFKNEGYLGQDRANNSFLVVLCPQPVTESTQYYIFSVDKAFCGFPNQDPSPAAQKEVRELWKQNPQVFTQERLFTFAYNIYMRGGNVFLELEQLISKIYK